MAVLSRVNFVGQQRVDLHDFAAIESFNAADMRAIISTFLGTDRVYVVRGLEVVSKNGLAVGIRVADCQILNPLDGNGSFYIGLRDDTDELIDLPADQSNIFVEAIFSNTTQAPVNRGLWDPLALSSDDAGGQEFSAAVDTQNIIQLTIQVNTTGFSEGAVPLFRASTSTSAVTSFTDSRPLLCRLGTGGAIPDPLNKFGFSATRDEAVPAGTGVANEADSPWRSRDAAGVINDKGLTSIKDWMDVVMTRLAEISGLLWYQNSAPGGASTNISLQNLWFDTIGHSIQPSKNSAFKWTDSGSGLVLAGSGVIPLNGTTSQYHSGLVRWQMNNTSLEWHLGGTFSGGGFRNYNSGPGLRFESDVPTDGGNIYLQLEREVPKGSGANVNWGDAGTSPFASAESVSGSPGDFVGIALGDYIRKSSGSFVTYYKVQRMYDGTVYNNAVAAEENKIADSAITALELISVSGDPSNFTITTSSEPLLYFRSRYSDDDIAVDTTAVAEGVIHDFQDNKFQWLGRRDGDLFFLRGYGTMQEGEEATTLDVVFAHGQKGGGAGSLTLEHAKEAAYDDTNGYYDKVGPGTLINIRRRRRDNTVDTPGSGSNSGALLSYFIDNSTAVIPAMTVGQGLWVRLSDTTSGELLSAPVTNILDDDENTDTATNRWEIRDAADTPVGSFDNVDVFLLARRIDINGQAALLFEDGSILTAFGQMLNTNVDISGRMRLSDYDDTAIPYMDQTGTKELKDDVTELFYNETTGVFGVRNLRIADGDISQDVPDDINVLSNLGPHTATLGEADSTWRILGDLIVDGTSFAANVANVQSEDKLISLAVGATVDSESSGAGFEIAENTLTSVSATSVSGQVYLDLVITGHPYDTGDTIGVNAVDDVGGIPAGKIGGQYVFVASGSTAGDAEKIDANTIRIWTTITATSSEVSTTTPPKTFESPWSIRLSDSSGVYTGGVTSYAFRVRGTTTAPTVTPVDDYGIVPTAHSVNMVEQRIPFVNNDDSGPADDSTLDFTSDFIWNNSTKTLVVTGDVNPGVTDTHFIGSASAVWKQGFFGADGLEIGTTNLYEDGNDGATAPSNILKSDGIIEAGAYMRGGRMLQLDETTSFTGPEPLPTGTDLNIFVRDGFTFQQDASGSQKLLTNVDGNIYNEKKTGLSWTASIDTPELDTIPDDTNYVLTNTALATVSAITGAGPYDVNIDLSVPGHGVAVGETITIVTSIPIPNPDAGSSITSSEIEATYTGVTGPPTTPGEVDVTTDPDVLTFQASSANSPAVLDSGFVDQIRTTRARKYVKGFNELEVYLNGTKQCIDIDYSETGTKYGSLSQTVNWHKDIDPTDVIEYRIDANGGQVLIKQAGGGDLQSAYDDGNQIITTGSNPVIIGGSSPKVAQFLGDIDVTGLIDPTGIVFTPQSSTPMDGTQHGMWTEDNAAKDLIYHIGTGTSVNLTQDLLYRDGSKKMTGILDTDTFNVVSAPAPTLNTHLTNKLFTDSTYLHLDGSKLMAADLDMDTFNVINPTAPTLATHLANKAYVDDRDRYTALYYDGTAGENILEGDIVYLDTSGEIRKAQADSILTSESIIGIAIADITAAAVGKIQIAGEAEVDILQSAAFNPGKLVFISEDTAGQGTSTVPDVTGEIVFSIGPATSTTRVIINPDFRAINSNVYREDLEILTETAALTTLTLPVDSRNGGLPKSYVPGSGRLRVRLNGEFLPASEVTESSTTEFKVARILDPGDVLSISIDPETTSYLLSAGGGASSLQAAYLGGSTVTITSGNPLTINGPVSEKLLVINGDLDVTGMIDPTGISFTTQVSDPTPAGQHGLYFNTSGEFIWSKDDGGVTTVNIGQILENSATPKRIESQFDNNSGAVITKASPVMVNASGELGIIDITTLDNALATVGLVSDDINHTASGLVTTHGRIENVTLTAIVGDILYISPTGGLIGGSELTSGSPKAGENGYSSEDLVVRVGVVSKNVDTPANKDIMIDVSILHQLP